MKGFLFTPPSLTAFVLATVIVGSGCSGTTAPKAFASLSIVGPGALRTGEAAQFRAMGIRSDGSQEEVVAQWSATSASVTVEGSSGSATGAQPGTGELRASLSGISAVRSLTVVPDMRGTWTGTLHFSCLSANVTRLVGEGPSICGKSFGWDYTTALSITVQQGESVSGTLALHGDNGISGPLSGTIPLDGTSHWPSIFTITDIREGSPYTYAFNGWMLLAQPSGISGSGELEKKFTNAWGYQHYVLKVATMTLAR